MGKSKHSVNSTSQSTLLHKGMTKLKVAAHLGYVVRLVLICKVGFAIIKKNYYEKQRLPRVNVSSLTKLRESFGVGAVHFSVFGIASESVVVGPGGDLPLLCLFPMATHDKLKCRR